MTSMVNEHISELPASSSIVISTVCRPMSNAVQGSMENMVSVTAQLSVAESGS